MKPNTRINLLFVGLVLISYLIGTVGFQVFAKMTVEDARLEHALCYAIKNCFPNLIAPLFLIAPFIAVGWMGSSLARKKSFGGGVALFIIGMLVLEFLYFEGYMGSEQALKKHAWTASALCIGLAPFESVPILLLLFFIYAFISLRGEKTPPALPIKDPLKNKIKNMR